MRELVQTLSSKADIFQGDPTDIFVQLDSDKDGKLQQKELEEGLHALGLNLRRVSAMSLTILLFM